MKVKKILLYMVCYSFYYDKNICCENSKFAMEQIMKYENIQFLNLSKLTQLLCNKIL
jgi:hypothetical protein